MSPRIRLEATRAAVLAVCSACPSWRELRATRAAANLAAAHHLDLCHGDSRRAADYRERAGADTPTL